MFNVFNMFANYKHIFFQFLLLKIENYNNNDNIFNGNLDKTN